MEKLTDAMRKLLIFVLLTSFYSVVCAQKVVGGDLSLAPAYEAAGDMWLDADGKVINSSYNDGIITYVKDVAGWNAVRVRLLVDPSADSYVATCQDLDYVKKLGKRVKDAGMSFLLDIFYSDTWTDVSAQWIPKSWGYDRNTPTATLATKVKSYTTEMLNALSAYGAAPDYVQIGNEVSYGMLWDSASGGGKNQAFYMSGTYDRYRNQIERFAALLTAASEGVRASVCKDVKIVLHCERTVSADHTINFYDWVGQAGFDDYDIIGLSYYPQWHGTLAMLNATLKELQDTFEEKEIQIVETGYFNNSNVAAPTYDTSATWPFSPSGQAAFLKDLIEMLGQYERVTGLYYWQPEECGNAADADGNNRVMDQWDSRGFWEMTWKSGRHALNSGAALMTLKKFLATGDADEEKDISSQFDNLDFEACEYSDEGGYVINCPGWDINFDNSWSSGPWPVKVNEWHSNMVDGIALQGWNESGHTLAEGVILSQSKEEMPAGTYTIAAIVHTDNAGIALFANETSAAVTSTSEWGKAYEVRVTTSLSSPGTLTFGLRFEGDVDVIDEMNLYADKFKVYYSDKTTSIIGDVNEDGVVNINDVVAIINVMAGTATWPNANVNGDEKVDINDVVAVINIMAGA